MKVLYFAWVRTTIGQDAETVSPPPEVASVDDLRRWLCARGPGHAQALGEPARLRAALDQEHVGFDAPLAGAAEVAFFPPITGG
ncbi:molybdopterin converting factor subunit 1 [Roseospirillum parvum]|uniref:Molybdopterin synthase sulfur carrier subunit n=1 Tax=Roseospirillum parvum TaxID=83401 RepID=A0A1G7V7Q7_9PROT|nr:molybdopterin converting factor subunit 1 [Roseospirillum parvum]SDG55796.1 molybdopterin synthase sulfur carrier subunit [Roseospirillum parvum]